jgi:signal transduction histidine kinase
MDAMLNPKEHIALRLSRAKNELEEALADIEKLPVFEPGMVSFAAHALNNFLTVTNATTELLRLHLDGAADTEAERLLGELLHTAELMRFVVARLMHTAAKYDVHLMSHELDLVSMAHRAREYYQRLADRKQLEIIVESAAESAVVYTDSVAFSAALDNLLTNAIKYSPPGKTIWLRVTTEPNAVVCAVQDQGPGISAEDQARLFQRGVRLSAVPTGGESSTGYGLAVAMELVTRLGGTLWCDSRPGVGSSFSIRLPSPRPPEGNGSSDTHSSS